MKSRRRVIPALSAFFVLAALVSGCGGGVPGNSIAVVAGNPITRTAFNHWMFVAAKGQAAQTPGAPIIVPTDPPGFTACIAEVRQQVPQLAKAPAATLKTDCNMLFGQLRDQVMDFLVRSYWYQAEAARMGIKVTDAQVQTAFVAAKQQQFPTDTQFQTFLTTSGQTLQDILYRVRVNQLYKKLVSRGATTVTPTQIQSYYQSHQSQFGTPETRNIRIILTKTGAQAQAAIAALKSGTNWNAAAKQFSTDQSTKHKGGLLVGIAKGQEDQALDKAAFSARPNHLSGPVKGQFGFYVYEVTKITKPTQQTLTQATPQIQQLLTQQQQTSGQSAVDSRAKQHWLAKTQCRTQFLMMDCKGYKAPATATNTTGAATPAPSGGTATVPPGASTVTVPPGASTPPPTPTPTPGGTTTPTQTTGP